MTKTAVNTAVIYSDIPPNEKQEAGFKEFLSKRYGEDISLVWKKVQYPGGGFRLKVGGEVYDWSVNGRFLQFQEAISELKNKKDNIVPLLRETIHDWVPKALAREEGTLCLFCDPPE